MTNSVAYSQSIQAHAVSANGISYGGQDNFQPDTTLAVILILSGVYLYMRSRNQSINHHHHK